MDDIIVGAPLGPRVTEVKPLDDYVLRLKFTNGEIRIFDAKPLLSMSAFKPLQNKVLFEKVSISHGSVFWSDDIDYCPDTLYTESVPISDKATNPVDLAAIAEPHVG